MRFKEEFNKFVDLIEKYPKKDIEFTCNSLGDCSISVTEPFESKTVVNPPRELEVINCERN